MMPGMPADPPAGGGRDPDPATRNLLAEMQALFWLIPAGMQPRRSADEVQMQEAQTEAGFDNMPV
jgi:hypothetical protein